MDYFLSFVYTLLLGIVRMILNILMIGSQWKIIRIQSKQDNTTTVKYDRIKLIPHMTD